MKKIVSVIIILILASSCGKLRSKDIIATESNLLNDNIVRQEVIATQTNINDEKEVEHTNNIDRMDITLLNKYDVVTYGKYEQDNDLTNGPEDIEWYVLNVENGKVLLFSKYVLDARHMSGYNSSSGYWSTLDIRNWLNNDFYALAFPLNNKLAVKKMESNQDHFTLGNTKNIIADVSYDKVFLLNKFELNNYVNDEQIKRGIGTKYAIEQGLFVSNSRYETNGNSMYWLSSAYTENYENTTDAHFVDSFNNITIDSRKDSNEAIGVRPCIIYDSNFISTESTINSDVKMLDEDELTATKNELEKNISLEEAKEFFQDKKYKDLKENFPYKEQKKYIKALGKNGFFVLYDNVVERDYTLYDADIKVVDENELIDYYLSNYNTLDTLNWGGRDYNDLVELEFQVIRNKLLDSKQGEDYQKVLNSEKIGIEKNIAQKMQDPEYQDYFNSNVLKIFPVGTEGVDYTVRNQVFKDYRLGKSLFRTDFSDGLKDEDGNGIDDRDPINVMGCYDLNYDGVDDRSEVSNTKKFGYTANGELETIRENSRQAYRLSYLCEHNVVNKFFVFELRSFDENSSERPICGKCYEKLVGRANEYKKIMEAVKAAGGESEYAGYKEGARVKMSDGWWTYKGNQVWVSDSGINAVGMVDGNGNFHITWGGIGSSGN